MLKALGYWFACFLVVVICARILVYRTPDSPPWRTIFPPENTWFEGSIAVDPNGTNAAVLARDGAGNGVLLIDLETENQRWVHRSDSASALFWNPDGTQIGFWSEGAVRLVEISTGRETVVREIENVTSAALNGRGELVWTDDSGGIFTAASGSEEPTALLSEESQFRDCRSAALFPSGDSIAFACALEGTNALLVMRLADRKPLVVRKGVSSVAISLTESGTMLCTQEGRSLIRQAFDEEKLVAKGPSEYVATPIPHSDVSDGVHYSVGSASLVYRRVDPARTNQPVWIRRDGTTGDAILPPGRYSYPEVNPRGDQVLIGKENEAGEVHLLRLELDSGAIEEISSKATRASHGIWSKDGAKFCFREWTRTKSRLAVRDTADRGQPPRPITTRSTDTNAPTSFTADGAAVLFDRIRWPGILEIAHVPVSASETDAAATVVESDRFDVMGGRVSPDGKWLAFTRTDGKWPEVYLRRIETGGKETAGRRGEAIKVSTNGGSEPRWRQDGAELYFRSQDGYIMAVELDITGGAIRTESPTRVASLFETHTYEDSLPEGSGYGVSPDGQRFLVLRRTELPAPALTVIRPWSRTVIP